MRMRTSQAGRLFTRRCSPSAYRHGLTTCAASSCVLLAALVRPSVADSGTTRPAAELVAPPSKGEQDRIGKEIHELFATELAATSPEGRRAAAQKLIDESGRKTIDDATRFVLLADAREIALAGGDFQESWNAVNELEEHFTVDGPAMKLELLQRFRKGKGSTDSARVASKRHPFDRSTGQLTLRQRCVRHFSLHVSLHHNVLALDQDANAIAPWRGRRTKRTARQNRSPARLAARQPRACLAGSGPRQDDKMLLIRHLSARHMVSHVTNETRQTGLRQSLTRAPGVARLCGRQAF